MTELIPEGPYMNERPSYNCTCIAISHGHPAGVCQGRGTYSGGVCHECRYAHTFPERRQNL